MSKLDKCAHRYPDDRPFDCCKLPREQHVPGMSHAFVEPVPQPPADATPTRRKLEELVDAIGDLPTTALATSGLRPADPPVTGDGNEACFEIATEVATEDWDTWGCPDSLEWVIGCALVAAQKAYAAGLARGREMGARDEREALKESILDKLTCDNFSCPHEMCRDVRGAVKVAIAHRAGRGT